tara:strand:- start:2238 stop:3551 length:1314 start_codon:yes stop_codon:yes gene_type:complete
MDFAQLQRAIQQNTKATTDLAGYDEDLARANALRDGPGAKPDSYGQTSPLSILASVVNKSKGRKDAGELGPLRKAARASQASSTANLEGDKLRQAMLAEQQGTEAHTLKQTLGQGNLDQQAQDLASNDAEADTWVSADGKTKIAVVYDQNNKPVLPNGQPVPEGFTPEGYSSGYATRGKALSHNNLLKITEDSNQVRKVGATANRFKGKYAQLGGLPTETLNNMLSTASRADLLKYASGELDAEAKEAAMWWADWKMQYELIQRHAIFGATLTNNEMSSWKDAVGLLKGMDPIEAEKRVKKLFRDLNEDLGNSASSARLLSNGRPNELAALDETLGSAGFTHDGKRYTFNYAPEADATTPEEELTPPPQMQPELQTYYNTLGPEDMKGLAQLPQEQQTQILMQMMEQSVQAPVEAPVEASVGNPSVLPKTRGGRYGS